MAPIHPSLPLNKATFPARAKTLKPTPLVEYPAPPRGGMPISPNIRSVTWSPTGALIATCTSAHIRVWNPDRPNARNSREISKGHNGVFEGGGGGSGSGGASVVQRVAFRPGEEGVLASTGDDGGVRVWDVRVAGGAVGAGRGVAMGDWRVKEGDHGLFLTWHPGGTEMLVGTRGNVVQAVDLRRLEPLDDPNPKFALTGTDRTPVKDAGDFNAMAFSNSGHEVFACTASGAVKVLDYPSMEVLHTIRGHTSATYAVQHSPRGEWVAVGGSDSMVTLWDTESWQCAYTVGTQSSAARSLSFSFDGAFLVAGCGEDAKEGAPGMEVIHVDSGEVVHTFDTASPVALAAWHPQRYWVAYTGDPGGLKVLGLGSNV